MLLVVAVPPHAVHPPGPHAGRQPSQNTASQDPYSAAHGLHAVQECKNFILLRTGVQKKKNPRVEGGIQEADPSSSSGLYLIDLARLAHRFLKDCSQPISRGSVAASQVTSLEDLLLPSICKVSAASRLPTQVTGPAVIGLDNQVWLNDVLLNFPLLLTHPLQQTASNFSAEKLA